MSRDSGNKSSAQRKSANTLLVGILAGIVIGVGMAAAVAWFMKRSPSPFVNREQPALTVPQPESALPAIPVEQPPAQTGNDKQRFLFYKILTDKQKTPHIAPAAPADQTLQVKPRPRLFSRRFCRPARSRARTMPKISRQSWRCWVWKPASSPRRSRTRGCGIACVWDHTNPRMK